MLIKASCFDTHDKRHKNENKKVPCFIGNREYICRRSVTKNIFSQILRICVPEVSKCIALNIHLFIHLLT